MAIVTGSVVSLRNTNLPAYNQLVQWQPPNFGIVQDATTTAMVVLWRDGDIETGIDETLVLDEIKSPTASNVTSFAGKVVRVQEAGGTNTESAEYDAVVVMLYIRDQAGAGTNTQELALVRLLSTGLFREVLVANLVVVGGR